MQNYTTKGQHVVRGIDLEELAEAAEGERRVVLPDKIGRGVWGGCCAAGARKLHLNLSGQSWKGLRETTAVGGVGRPEGRINTQGTGRATC